jgi:hypothetical protein
MAFTRHKTSKRKTSNCIGVTGQRRQRAQTMKTEMGTKQLKRGDVPDKLKCKNRGFTVSSRTFFLATSQGFSYLAEGL